MNLVTGKTPADVKVENAIEAGDEATVAEETTLFQRLQEGIGQWAEAQPQPVRDEYAADKERLDTEVADAMVGVMLGDTGEAGQANFDIEAFIAKWGERAGIEGWQDFKAADAA